MTSQYPWYELVAGEELEQGDLLLACPVIVPVPEISFPVSVATIPANVLTYDVIVMTQSCDLVNNKTREVILCPHWDLGQAGQMDTTLAKKEAQKAILKGYRPRYTMLALSDNPALPMGVRIVDFGVIFSLPKAFVSQFAAKQGKRLRVSPPYREHLSQAFARFFMRVGLPQDIDLPT